MNGKPPTEKAAGPDSFSVEECSSGFLPEESEKKRLFFVLLAWQNSSILRVNLMESKRT